ncbi:hypothetical protein R5W24_001576 [Gemmata sp. JC717]|uniref:hypothetical protein n=1 Tax=Gemmata algarum TaxID=2975278 RepID=UPI0021BA8142|nr:hypothetical protein [Gemmata algarum]MDY3552493.1 hypothetical protein [Gemmata algarum]
MSEPAAQPSVPGPTARGVNTWAYTLVFCALAVAAAGGYYFYEKSRNPLPPPVDEIKSLKDYVARLATTQKLADGYADADGDLVADRPADASKLVKVGDELVFSVVGTDDEKKLDEAEKGWASFTAALAKATGKKVTYARDLTSPESRTLH